MAASQFPLKIRTCRADTTFEGAARSAHHRRYPMIATESTSCPTGAALDRAAADARAAWLAARTDATRAAWDAADDRAVEHMVGCPACGVSGPAHAGGR